MGNSTPEDERKALSSFRILSFLNFIVGIIAYYAWKTAASGIIEQWPFVLNVSFSLICTILSLTVKRLPLYVSSLLVLISFLLAINVEAVVNVTMAISGLRYQAFLTSKAAALAVALIAFSPTSLGFLIIGLCTVFPIVEYFILIPEEFRANVQKPEPWATLIFTLISSVILAFRSKMSVVEHQLLLTKTEKDAAEKRLTLLMAIRDLSNSPLQVIEFVSELLHSEHPETDYLAERLDNSLNELRKLNDLLKKHEANGDTENKKVSFDATKTLHELLGY